MTMGVWTCFALSFSGPVPRSAYELDTHVSITAVSHLRYCCITWWVGGSLRVCHHLDGLETKHVTG